MERSNANLTSPSTLSVILVAFLWTALVGGLLLSVRRNHQRQLEQFARMEARTAIARDLALVRWSGRHGGVYVPATSHTPPNPYLAHMPEREVTTPSGRQLTLMNSAYILRQIYGDNVGERLAPGHVTSLRAMRPDNAPDAWEAAALEAFVAGKEQVSEVVQIGGRPHFRLMQRMAVEAQCLTCHNTQDYKLGDVRGGISVAVDLAPYMAADAAITTPLALTHASIWLLGLLGIVAGSRQIRERFQERLEVENALRLDEARLEALLQLNHKSREPFAELIHFAMEESVRLTGSQVGYVALVSEDESVLTMHAWSKTALHQCAMQDKPQVYPLASTGLWGEAVRRREPVITNDYASSNPSKRGLPENHVPVTRHMNVPIFDGERIVIVAGVGNKPGEYDESDVRQVTLLMSELWRIAQWQQAEAAVRRGEEMYRSLVEHLPQRIIVKDRNSVFVSCNANFAREHALQPDQIAGLDDFAFYPSDLAEKYREDDRAVMAAEIPSELEELNQIDGRDRWVHVHKVPYRDDLGQVVGVLGIFEDVTSRKQAEEEIRSLNQSLEQRVQERTAQLLAANGELEAFSYSVSHDLRAPLRAIHGFARILMDDYQQQLDEQGRHVLNVVCSEARRMGRLIDDLLNFCRLGKCALQVACIDMEGMVREVYCELQQGAAGRHVELHQDRLPAATADPILVRQVWVNLLDNALKYTRRQARARIEIGGSTANGESVYHVRDNGVGLDTRYADKLFRVFERLHEPGEFEGTGVGLATVQRIVHLHGGQVWVESEPEQGATFFFTLPGRGRV